MEFQGNSHHSQGQAEQRQADDHRNLRSNFNSEGNPSTHSKINYPNSKLNALLEAHYQSLAKPKIHPGGINPNKSTNFAKLSFLAQEKNTPNQNVSTNIAFNSIRDSFFFKRTKNGNDDTKLKEGGPVSLVKAYLEAGYNCAIKGDFEKALAVTTQAKSMVEKHLLKNWKFEFDILIQLFHNLTTCNYKLRNMTECVDQARNALMNFQAYKIQKKSPKVLWNFENSQDRIEFIKILNTKNLYKKLRCKTHLQSCILYSELGEHSKAFSHARKAAKLSFKFLQDSFITALHLYAQLKGFDDSIISKENRRVEESKSTERHRILNPSSSRLVENHEYQNNTGRGEQSMGHLLDLLNNLPQEAQNPRKTQKEWIEYLEGVLPILEEINSKIQGKKQNVPLSNRIRMKFVLKRLLRNQTFKNADMQKLYGNLPPDHFLFTSNLMTVTQLRALTSHELSGPVHLFKNIETDNLVEEILLLTISLYCISTELRFWDEVQQGGGSPVKKMDILIKDYQPVSNLKKASELWIGRCLSFSFVYLPHNTPITGQIFNIFCTVYDPTRISIPEEEEVDYQVKYLVPAKGINKTSNYFIPIVKKGLEDEMNGMEFLLLSNKDHTASTTKIIEKLDIFDNHNKFYDLLLQNYAEKRINSREAYMTNGFKGRVSLKSNRPHSNSNLNRMSSHSPNPHDNSFQKLQRIYLGNSFFKTSEDDQSNMSATKDQSEIDIRVTTDPNCDSSQPILKDLVLQIETKSSLSKIRPKPPIEVSGIRKSLKLIPKNKESLNSSSNAIRTVSSSKLSVSQKNSEGGGSALITNTIANLGQKNETNVKVEASCEVSLDGSISNITKITLNNSGSNLRKINLKDSFEDGTSLNQNINQVVSDIAERRNLKPFRSSVEGNLQKFLKRTTGVKEKSHSPEVRRNWINTSGDSQSFVDNFMSKSRVEERTNTSIVLPPRPKKNVIKTIAQHSIRPSSSLKQRVTFDDNTKRNESSFNSEGSHERLFETSMIVTNITKETMRLSEGSGNMRSLSVGREGQHKQKRTFKKITELS